MNSKSNTGFHVVPKKKKKNKKKTKNQKTQTQARKKQITKTRKCIDALSQAYALIF